MQIRQGGKDLPELQSALGRLATFIDELTPAVVDVWAAAAPHANVNNHGSILIEHLARLAREFPTEVSSIFRAALVGFLPDYRKEDVIRCVTGLAEANQVEEAESICNVYAEHGSILLKDTYEALRAEQRARKDSAGDSLEAI